ncbi:MAG: TetR/AcrR family transcriptional regulator C-terminal domain-containing protein [Propionibacteriaceae bacterium]
MDRLSLSQERIVRHALEILDSYGLADLTMRRLGDGLGVRASALYWHVPNKQSLLALVADAMVQQVQQPLEGTPWREALVMWMGALRTSLLSHRDSAELCAAARASGLTKHDMLITPTRVLVAAGMAETTARSCAATLIHLLLGAVADEQAHHEWNRLRGSEVVSVEVGSDFTFGLGLILDGIAAELM